MCLRLHPMSALCKRVSLCFFPPRERLVAAMLGPSVQQTPQPAIHCAYSVHSLGPLPVVVLSLGGRPRRAGLAGPLPLCPSTVSSPMSTVAWAVWLLKESCLAVCDLRGFGRGSIRSMPGPRSWPVMKGVCPLGKLGNLHMGFCFALERSPAPLVHTASHSSPPVKSAWCTVNAQEMSADKYLCPHGIVPLLYQLLPLSSIVPNFTLRPRKGMLSQGQS